MGEQRKAKADSQRREQISHFGSPTGAGGIREEKGWEKAVEDRHRQGGIWKEKKKNQKQKSTLPGGINGTRRGGTEFAIKHTLLARWQAVPTRCQVKAGVGDSLRSACPTGGCHAGDFDFIAGKGRSAPRLHNSSPVYSSL